MANLGFQAEGDTNGRHGRAVKILLGHLWPEGRIDLKVRVVLAMVFLIAAKLLGVYLPVVYKEIVDALSSNQRPIAFPFVLLLAYGSIRLGQTVFGELRDWVFVQVGQNAKRTIALNTFKHLHQLPLAFHLDRQTGGLSRVIERGTRGIQFILSFMLFNIMPIVLELFLVAVAMSFYFDFSYALVTILTVVLYITFTLVITEWRLKFRKEMNTKDTAANTKAIDSLLNFETVKYFGNEAHEYERFDESLKGYEKAAVQSQRSLSFLNSGQAAIISIGTLGIMALAAQDVVDQTFTIGDFVMANTYILQLFLPLNFLGFVYREMKQSLIDMDKMMELADVVPSIQDHPDAQDLEVSSGKIEFSNVSFSYDGKRPIIDNVSFSIEPGQKVAIVGPTGSGKSTISRLLFRFYDPDQGDIRIDGKNIRQVTQGSLRENIGVVPQDTVLFNDTIGYNIAYGKPDAENRKVSEAARLAKLTHLIDQLSEGMDTKVGERGLKLSGGEKQRVAIARTILKNPPILIFDEATSALDTRTERDIQKSLTEVSKNRSTLIVAHRLSTIVDCDQIIVLQSGKIIEHGDHQSLLNKDGEYAAMWNRQQQAEDYQKRLRECMENPSI